MFWTRAIGSGLLEYHNSSLIKCLQALYPTHEWLEWKFSTVTSMFWADISNQRKYFVWLKNEIGIKQYSDWYDVDVNVLKKHRGSFPPSFLFSRDAILTI
jgi:hypothetical protein